MFKKFSLIYLCLFIASCASDTIKDEGGAESYSTDIEEIGISDGKSFRTAMLLPLTGNDAKYGQGLKKASMIALNQINNPNLVLQYYDTQSTPSGARIAVENAANQGADLIVGPLKSQEVQAISNETIYRGIPVIAFSTAQEVLQPTVYSMGLLVEEQVDRIISYAAKQGRVRFALLLPDNGTGAAVAKAAVKAAQKNNVEITKIGFFKPGTSDFSTLAKQMSNYDRRHANVARIRASLQSKANAGDTKAINDLKKLSTREGLGDVGFDALLIAENGAKLTAAVAMFSYYDVAYPQVQFLGTSIWEGSKLNNEAIFNKSLYPSVDKNLSSDFATQYYMIFNERPSSLYTLAYDAVAIASQLASSTAENINENITDTAGFNGINGKIRFFKDGSNQHSLSVVEISRLGNISVDNGNAYFESISEPLPEFMISGDYRTPQIFGKDAALAQIIIYGQMISQPTLTENENLENNETEIIRQQLKSMGISINQ